LSEEDLDLIVRNIIFLFPEHPELHSRIYEAWKELRPRMRDMADYLMKVYPRDLVERGLTGEQLDLEISLYKVRRNEFRRDLGFIEKFRPLKALKKLRRSGCLLLDSIQTILESLCFIPSCEAIRQFKDVLKNAICE
jgi:hypothetical protein